MTSFDLSSFIDTALFTQTIIGKSSPSSYEGSEGNHQSECWPVAHRTVWDSAWSKTLTKEEQKRLNLEEVNRPWNKAHNYHKSGYQLYSTHRGAFVLVPRAHDSNVILFVPKKHTISKPVPPSSMTCTNAQCNHGSIRWNGSCYPCAQCTDILNYERALAVYNELSETTK